jgi:hypothetical protein
MHFAAERVARIGRDIDRLRAELKPYVEGRMRVGQNGIDMTPKRIANIRGEIATLEKIVRASRS